MHSRVGRIAALLGAGALALAAVSPVAAAEPLKAVVAVDDGTPDAGKAWVRVLHGSPDTPSVDVYVGAENDLAGAAKVDALSGATFGMITDYVPVDAGTYAVKVCATADATLCPIEVPSLPLEDGKKYTVAAYNVLASIDYNVFEDGATPAEGNAAVRVVHLSADTPAVDVLTQAGESIGIDGLEYENATPYAEFPAGSYDLKVCASADNSICPLDPGPLPLDAGVSYSVFAVGSLAATVDDDDDNGPAPTMPPTSTIAPTTDAGSSNGSLVAIVGILGLAGLAGVGLSRRFATRRVEK
jgi:hypothetical protein